MTDYHYIYSSKMKHKSDWRVLALFILFVIVLGIVGHFEQEPVDSDPRVDIITAQSKGTQK